MEERSLVTLAQDGSSKDYNFGQKITPTGNMTLYPAVSKYGMGDNIDGKTIIYVRKRNTKDKLHLKLPDFIH